VSSSLRRGVIAASALVLPLVTLSACGAGNDAQTMEIKPDSAATSVGDIKLQAITVVTEPTVGAQGPAVVTGTVFNNGRTSQTLDSIKLPGTSATVEITPAKGGGQLTIPALSSVALGGKGHASAVIQDGSAATDGNAQQVVFTFSKTGDVGLRALVVPATQYFTKVGPSAAPTPSTRPSASGSPSGKPSGKPSGGPSGSPSGKPSKSASDNTAAGGGLVG
jgi:hypothetical protein